MLVSLFSFDHSFCVTPITPPNIEVNLTCTSRLSESNIHFMDFMKLGIL